MLVTLALLSACARRQPTTTGTVIGIDLGTTYSCVAVFLNDAVEILTNEAGHRTTPSLVSFTDTTVLVGEAAKTKLVINPRDTIFAVKRLMGLRYSDPLVQAELPRLPYVVVNKSDRPFIEVPFDRQRALFSPEEISAMILTKMKTIAESYLGHEVTHAVVTVPAHFNDARRKATLDAGEIAGLTVLRVLSEPTAAAIAYGLHRGGSRLILIFDLGGGTFDLSVMTVNDELFSVLATAGDTHLGGEDFDDRIVAHLQAVFERRSGRSIAGNRKALARLRREAVAAKHALSELESVEVSVEDVVDGIEFIDILTRAKFEELCGDLFRRTIPLLGEVLSDAGVGKEEIDDVVLVGGSTRIPKVQAIVAEYFGRRPSQQINPDEAVAYGAAVTAASLSGKREKTLALCDVNPMTLGIGVSGDIVDPVVPRNTRIPVVRALSFTTCDDDIDELYFPVYEGERPMIDDCHFVGGFTVSGIERAPRGVPQIEVTFEIDANGVLTVTGRDVRTGANSSLTVQSKDARLTEEQRWEAIARAELMREEDARRKSAAIARTRLENFLRDRKRRGNSDAADLIADALAWLEAHPREPEAAYTAREEELRRELADDDEL
jgi:heat shock protein 5